MKLKFKKRFSKHSNSDYLYGIMPVWKATLKVGITGVLMSFFLGLFTFADQLMLVNFMPETSRFCFNNLFFLPEHNIFEPILNNISLQAKTNISLHELYMHIISQRYHQGKGLENLVLAISNLNGLGIYNADSIVRSAVSLSLGISDIAFIIPALYSVGASVKYSQALGKGDYRQAMYIWQNSFYGTIFVTLIGTIITFILIPFVIPAQAAYDHISNSELKNTITHISRVLSNNNLTDNYIFTNNSNEIYEHLYFLKKYENYEYFIKVNPLTYISITNNELLNVNNNNLLTHLVHFQHSLSSFKIKLVNFANDNDNQNVTNIWNNYFNLVRTYSINWAEDFLFIITAGLIIASVASLMLTILRSDGAIIIVTIMTIIPVTVNILLDFILIYYAQIGMDGAAVATLIGWSLEVIASFLYVSFSKKIVTSISLKTLKKEYLYLKFHISWELLMYGGTVFIINTGWMITDILLTNQVTIISDFLLKNAGSEYYLSIMGACLPITNLLSITFIGLLQYVSPLFSYNYASNNFKRLKETFWYSTLLTFILSFGVYFIIGFIHPITYGILDWFHITKNTANSALFSATRLLQLWLMQVPAYTFSIGSMCIYLSSNRPGLSVLVGLIRSCLIFIPVLYIFSAVVINHHEWINQNLTLAEINDPYTNKAMWCFLWSVPTSYIVASVIVILLAIDFTYRYVEKDKRKLMDCFPFILIKKIYLKSFLKEM